MSKYKLSVSNNFKALSQKDREYWRAQTPEIRLDAVELLRLQAGKFLYEYPTRLRRIIKITRKA